MTPQLKTSFAAIALFVGMAHAQNVNVAVSDSWARATVQGQKATGAFMTLTAKDGAKLVGVSSPVAGVAEIHEMKMDKDVMKRLLRDAGVPIARFVTVRRHDKVPYSTIKKELGLPLFVKPANMGSSVGVSKVSDEKEFVRAVAVAFKYDTKILIEECVAGREIECAVLGNEEPRASVAGELIVQHAFYSYEAKYVDDHGAVPQIPAQISKRIEKRIQELAVKTFVALGCEGMGRVDFFLRDDGSVVVNEINTIPGFTNISMYPKLWEASGIGYSKLIDILIQLAIARHKRDAKLKTSFT